MSGLPPPDSSNPLDNIARQNEDEAQGLVDPEDQSVPEPNTKDGVSRKRPAAKDDSKEALPDPR